MELFNSLIISLRDALSPVLTVPNSALFIFGIAFGLALLVVTVSRLAVDAKKIQAFELEIKKHTHDLKEAKEKADKAALRRLKREELRLKPLRSYVSKHRLNASFITVFPLMIIYIIINAVYLGEQVVAFPFDFPIVGPYAPFSVWYLLCYFTTYLPLSKLFNVSPT